MSLGRYAIMVSKSIMVLVWCRCVVRERSPPCFVLTGRCACGCCSGTVVGMLADSFTRAAWALLLQKGVCLKGSKAWFPSRDAVPGEDVVVALVGSSSTFVDGSFDKTRALLGAVA